MVLSRIFKSWLALIAVLAIASASPVRAAIASISATPSTIAVNRQGDSFVTLRYQVGLLSSPTNAVTSASGAFFAGGSAIATVGGPISANVSSADTVRLTERVRVPRAVARRIASGETIVYRRVFDDGSNQPTPINVATRITSAGALSFRDLSVRFDDESAYRIVRRGAEITARARAVTIGSGLLSAAWEVSGPAHSTQSAFATLQRVQRRLSGGRATVFESPPLPTDRPGLYTVRFTPLRGGDATFANSFGVIRYFVTLGDALRDLELTDPPAGERADPATQFSWVSSPAAAGYRLEFRGARAASGVAGRSVAAVDLPADDRRIMSTRLQSFTLRRLVNTRASYWRVIAYDAAGAPIAASSLRRLGVGRGASAN